MFPITGTLINVAAVIVGGSLGALLGNRLPEKTRQTVLAGLGLMTLIIGITMAIQTTNVLIPLFSILLGGILGEALRIDDGLNWLGRKAESRFGGASAGQQDGETGGKFAQGFITASLIFCIGPMTILGSLQNGLMGDYSLLTVKSVLDGFAAMALAASLGAGVILSAGTVLAYQGGLSLLAMLFATALGRCDADDPLGDRDDGHRRCGDPEHRVHPAGSQAHTDRELAAGHLYRAADSGGVERVGCRIAVMREARCVKRDACCVI